MFSRNRQGCQLDALSPLGSVNELVTGEKEGHSYLRRADNPQQPQRAETLTVLFMDSTFAPSCTSSHLSQCFRVGVLKIILHAKPIF